MRFERNDVFPAQRFGFELRLCLCETGFRGLLAQPFDILIGQ